MIDQKDFRHGAALVAIADSEGFTALNRATVKYGHYVVNHDRHLFIKYCGERGPEYTFTFSPEDKRRIREEASAHVYAVLVCGTEVITAVPRTDLATVVDLTDTTFSSSLKVSAPPRRMLRVTGNGHTLPYIARRSFPGSVLG